MNSPSDTVKVQCTCGHEFRVPGDEVGVPVECPACGAEIVARALAEDSAEASRASRQLLGELAVELGLVSQEHLDLCVEYQRALRSASSQPQKRIGEILVEKGLLKPQQVERLLGEQRGETVRKRPTPVPLSARAPEPPSTERLAEAPEPPKKKAARRRSRRPLAYALALLVLGGLAALAVLYWPMGGARATLVAYLGSCREGHEKPDAMLGAPGPGLVVRSYRVEKVAEPTTWDYSSELRLFQGQKRTEWRDMLDIVGVNMPPPKREALAAAVVLFPAEFKPRGLLSLTITLQPITCGMQYRRTTDKLFRSGTLRFPMVRVDAPGWSCPWRVGGFQEVR